MAGHVTHSAHPDPESTSWFDWMPGPGITRGPLLGGLLAALTAIGLVMVGVVEVVDDALPLGVVCFGLAVLLGWLAYRPARRAV